MKGVLGGMRVIAAASVGIYAVPVLGLVGPWFLADPGEDGRRER